MSNRDNSARTPLVVSDERIRNVLRREIDRAINVDRDTTRAQLEADSGVNIHTIDSITTRDAAKHRSIKIADAFSIAYVLGERTVNALLSTIAYKGAVPLDAEDADCPLDSAVASMSALSVFMSAAADRRIDHTEAAAATQAADMIIAEMIPFSSAGKQA